MCANYCDCHSTNYVPPTRLCSKWHRGVAKVSVVRLCAHPMDSQFEVQCAFNYALYHRYGTWTMTDCITYAEDKIIRLIWKIRKCNICTE